MNGFTILFSPRATRRTTLVAILMLLPALQQPQAQPAGLAAIKASNTFIDCLLRAARRLDDGRSAPASVGKSAQAACPDEQRRWEDAQTAKYSGSKMKRRGWVTVWISCVLWLPFCTVAASIGRNCWAVMSL